MPGMAMIINLDAPVAGTCRKKMSAHCMQGYMICAALSSSSSPLPIIVPHRLILVRLLRLAMSMTSVQYSPGRLLISSEALRKSTCSEGDESALLVVDVNPGLLLTWSSESAQCGV